MAPGVPSCASQAVQGWRKSDRVEIFPAMDMLAREVLPVFHEGKRVSP